MATRKQATERASVWVCNDANCELRLEGPACPSWGEDDDVHILPPLETIVGVHEFFQKTEPSCVGPFIGIINDGAIRIEARTLLDLFREIRQHPNYDRMGAHIMDTTNHTLVDGYRCDPCMP